MATVIINNPSFINGVLYSCRTCFDPGNPIFSLKEECTDTKTWRDLLRDVAQLQTSEEDSFPNTICCKCLDNLIKFYDFMIQIKNVDKRYQELLTISIKSDEDVEESCKAIDSSSDSLIDSDTDMPMEEFISEIKVEEEQITPYDIVLNNNENDNNTTLREIPYEEQITPYDIVLNNNENADNNTTLREIPYEELNDINNQDQEVNLNVNDNLNKNSQPKEGTKSPENSTDLNTEQIAEIFGRRLYHKPTTWQRVECKLCNATFLSTKALRMHLENHKDLTAIQNLNLSHPVVQHLFPNIKNLNFIGNAILNDFAKKNYFKYYSVLNEYHYEMSISDTEAEDLDDEIVKHTGKYKCALCGKEFSFKYQNFLHLKTDHAQDNIPFKCSKCQLQFISANLYNRHIKTHCNNEHKVLHCLQCPGKFVWPENLKNHNCPLNNTETSTQLIAEIKTYPSTSSTIAFQNLYNTSLVDESTEDVTAKISSNTNAEMSIDVELLLESSYLYYCVMCPKTFFTLEHLNKHLRNHRLTSVQIKTVESIVHSTWWPNGEKIIKCKICEQTFKTMAKLKEHFSPSNQQQNVCANKHSLANYSITNQKGFELHLELDSETEIEDDHNNEHNRYIPIVFPYSCCICRKMFRRKYQVAQHQRSMHDYQLLELKCERCIFRTVSRKILDYHRTTQCFNKEKQYECNQCNFKFMWKENLEKHILTFHTSNKIINEATSSSSKNEDSNKQCNLKFMNSDKHIAIFQTSNNVVNDSSSSSNKNKDTNGLPFKCTLCEKSFSQLASLNIHKRLHKNNNTHKCTICLQSFNKLEDLKQHSLSHTKYKGYKCNVCNKNFLLESYLEAHRRLVGHKELFSTTDNKTINSTHNTPTENMDEKQYRCNFCVMTFKEYRELLNHLRMHSQGRPFSCTYCEKSFKLKSELTTHQRVHTGQRPFKCFSCGSRFIDSKTFKQHMRLHSGGKPYK